MIQEAYLNNKLSYTDPHVTVIGYVLDNTCLWRMGHNIVDMNSINNPGASLNTPDLKAVPVGEETRVVAKVINEKYPYIYKDILDMDVLFANILTKGLNTVQSSGNIGFLAIEGNFYNAINANLKALWEIHSKLEDNIEEFEVISPKDVDMRSLAEDYYHGHENEGINMLYLYAYT